MAEGEIPRRRVRGWVIVALSVAIGVLCTAMAVYTSFFGMGTYWPTKVLFPWTMVSTAFTGLIATPWLVFMLFQFPLYGLILAWANRRGRLRAAAVAVSALHVAGVALAVLFANPGFNR